MCYVQSAKKLEFPQVQLVRFAITGIVFIAHIVQLQ